MSRLAALGRVLRLLRSEADRSAYLYLACTGLTVILGAALAAASPLALKQLVDAVAARPSGGPAPQASVGTGVVIYLAVICCARAMADLRPWLSGALDQHFQARLTRRFFDQLSSLPIAFFQRRRSGELLHSLDLAATGAQLAIGHLANSILPALIELATMAGILAGLGEGSLLFIFTATAIAYFVIFTVGGLCMAQPAQRVSQASLAVYAQLNEGIAHMETLRCFGAETTARQVLLKATATLESRWLGLLGLNLWISAAATLTFGASMTLCLVAAAQAVERNALSVGGFVLASVYMLQMVRPLEQLGSAARDVSRAIAFLRPLLDILDEQPDAARTAPTTRPIVEVPEGLAPGVAFDDVHFEYAPQRPVFTGLSLTIQAGRTTAIVGPSGSGKSSLARLLMRLYSPRAGRVLLDGRSITDFQLDQLRCWIGWVPQETGLLHTTIANNIALGMPDASRADIESAARAAQLHDVIARMPDGYETVVGERGLQLSGGERQRVAIARALLRRPVIYLLDEPTSMLDARTEAAVLETLRTVTAGTTTLFIAHRLHTVVQADDIVVLEAGQVRERGTHLELLQRGGLYARLWSQQQGDPSSPPTDHSRRSRTVPGDPTSR